MGLLIGRIVTVISRVVFGPTLWVEVPAQACPGPSCQVGIDPIGSGSSWVRVGFSRAVPRAAHWTQPI